MSQITGFYLHSGEDNKGRTLAEILLWDDKKLEETHDFIQWLFPLNEASSFNPDAPILTEEDIKEFHDVDDLKLINSAVMIINFFSRGLKQDAPQYWLKAGNHNHLRITRVIKCLRIMGWSITAEYFCEWAVKKNKDGMLDIAIPYWKEAASSGE